MSWYDIIKLRQDSWNALTQVIIGEYDYELWKDTPIPEELKEMKKEYDKQPEDIQNTIRNMLQEGSLVNDEMRMGIFSIIMGILDNAVFK